VDGDLEEQYQAALRVVTDGSQPQQAREAAAARLAELAPKIARERMERGELADDDDA
jgi:hypothetical protein